VYVEIIHFNVQAQSFLSSICICTYLPKKEYFTYVFLGMDLCKIRQLWQEHARTPKVDNQALNKFP
jgi:hypothetical protein